ncbi:hypothetical protein DYB32_005975 [Aphanomyces invadans]|uniref:Uncharacterized protein n=1 Tax=Aphanomyces invadans TaxID=157072 RepID=A0A3R7CYU5_9STRA|nr:hypothetical protein DYB32_005975 [Aphanomyces invadans]
MACFVLTNTEQGATQELRAALSHYPDTLILQADIKPGEHSKKAESLPPSPLLPARNDYIGIRTHACATLLMVICLHV